MIIQTIIQGESWKEAFEIPSTSDRGELDTPLIKLIRQLPDMAEEVLDRCCEEPPDKIKKDVSVIKMYTDFIGAAHKYQILKNIARFAKLPYLKSEL